MRELLAAEDMGNMEKKLTRFESRRRLIYYISLRNNMSMRLHGNINIQSIYLGVRWISHNTFDDSNVGQHVCKISSMIIKVILVTVSVFFFLPLEICRSTLHF